MDRELKAKWVAALLSGDYSQTTGKLRRTDGYCCLGVLADIIDPEGWSDPTKQKAVNLPPYMTWNKVAGFLPHKILDKDSQMYLSSLNDTGNSFKKIAKWIKANVHAD